MHVTLKRAVEADVEGLWKMQGRAFLPLAEKYGREAAPPAWESLETVKRRFHQNCSDYYVILVENTAVGGVRVIRRRDARCNISPLFIVPEYQRRGIAYRAMLQLEALYPNMQWELNTILQEKGNCRLYEKLGYRRTGEIERINERVTLVYYRKRRKNEGTTARGVQRL